MSDETPATCVQCARKLPEGALACPECGRPVLPIRRGLGMFASALLMLWPVPLVIFALSLAEAAPIILSGALLLLNGPVSLVIVRNSFVAPDERTWRVLKDLGRASPASAALAFVLLGLTWFLPVLALGGCVCILIVSAGRW